MVSKQHGKLPDNLPQSPMFKQIYCVLSASQIYVKGAVTGVEYLFHGGKPVSVDIRDIPDLLKHKSSHGVCCNGVSERNIFVIIQEEK